MAGSEADGLPQPVPWSPASTSPDASSPDEPGVPPLPAPADRPLELRLASIHLRTGALALARAELETSAGRGELDDAGLLDLAEVRWRTDDVTGAGEAAAAYFATGREDTLALVIATEATASIGRSTEARRLAARTLARGDVALDAIFRGIRPSSYWPPTSALAGEPAGTLFGGPRPGSTIGTPGVTGAAVLGRLAAADAGVDDPAGSPGSDPDRPLSGVAPVAPAGGDPTAGPLTPTLWAETEMQPLSDDADLDRARRLPEPTAEIEAARADLAGGRAASAAVRLAIVLRVAPDLALTVLELLSAGPAANALSGPAHVASIELVRGDALRLAGREAEARRAYAAAAALLVEPAQ